MGLMEMFENPDLFTSLTMGERVLGALMTALMGMGTTFVILILIWGCIAVIGKGVRLQEGAFAKKPDPVPVPESAPAATVAAPVTEENDDALIAVIAAAIAAAQGAGITSNLVVRKITRIPGPDPAWSNTGRHEALDSRRV